MKKRVVIAGSFREYKRYVIEHGGARFDRYLYAHDWCHLAGLREIIPIFTGQYWLNPLYNSPYLREACRLLPKRKSRLQKLSERLRGIISLPRRLWQGLWADWATWKRVHGIPSMKEKFQ